MTTLYNNGASIGATQLVPHHYIRKALVEAKKETYFTQLADVTTMPKNEGVAIKQYRMIPVLDDRNTHGWGLDATGARYEKGNLYGSSKDVGKIIDKFPLLGEKGGRVNKIDFTRVELQSSLIKAGIFFEYSADLIRHDTDSEIYDKMTTELMNTSVKLYEDRLQADLLNNAGLVKYAGSATQVAGLDATSELTYKALVKLSIDLDNARCPKQTKMITGTREIDTRTISDGRIAYCGSELIPTLLSMVDEHNRPALVPLHQYASGTMPMNGEFGSIAGFRIIIVPEMQKWAGKGATGNDARFYRTDGKYDVFPFLVVGDQSFTTIGFTESSKGGSKVTVINKKPGTDTASATDPYGEMGFTSAKWWYGFMPQFVERLAVIKCTAKM